MPDPNRNFPSYSTTVSPSPSKMDIQFSNSSRPAASAVPVGHEIWNSDDEGPNWSNGVDNWYGPDAAGGYGVT